MACLGNILSKPMGQVANDCASGFMATASNLGGAVATPMKFANDCASGFMATASNLGGAVATPMKFANGVYNYGLEGAGVFAPAALILGSGIFCAYQCLQNLRATNANVNVQRNNERILTHKWHGCFSSTRAEDGNESDHQAIMAMNRKKHANYRNKTIAYGVAALSLVVLGSANMIMFLKTANSLGK